MPGTEVSELKTQREIVDLVQQLTEQEPSKRLSPDILTSDDKDLIIEFLRYNENLSYSRIGQILNMTSTSVRSRATNIDKHYRARVLATGIDPHDSIAELRRVKDVVQQKAAQKQDWALVWKTELDDIQACMALGLFKKHYTDDEVVDAEFEEKVREVIAGNNNTNGHTDRDNSSGNGVQTPQAIAPPKESATDANGNISAKVLRQTLEEIRTNGTTQVEIEEPVKEEPTTDKYAKLKERRKEFGDFFKSRKAKKTAV